MNDVIWIHRKIAKRKIGKNNSISQVKINTEDVKKIHVLYSIGIVISGLIGALAVLIYYLPLYIFQTFFDSWIIKIFLLDNELEFNPITSGYSFLCLILEIYFLGLLNIYLVKELTKITRFPAIENEYHNFHLDEVQNISLENFKSRESDLGLNPFFGMSKMSFFLFLIFNKMKAFLSNFFIKMVFRKFFGRYFLRLYTDLIGMPIYFFWNAYATRTVFLKAKYYIFGQILIDEFVLKLKTKYQNNSQVKEIIYEILAQVAIKKRAYSAINYYFAVKMLNDFNIQIKQTYIPDNQLIKSFKNLDKEIVNDLIKLILIGFIADGSLNKKEKLFLDELIQNFNIQDTVILNYKDFLTAYKDGKAIELIN